MHLSSLVRLNFIKIFLFAFALLVILPIKVGAVSPSSILVNVAPENPAPNENTTITLNSYAANLDSVMITWSVNGKNSSSGVGKKSFSLKAPSSGSETDIVASISFPDGTVDTRIVIRPVTIALLWQAEDSYVPPFYKGKALPTADSQVKVVAIPEVRLGSTVVNSNNMVYAWKKDYTNDQNGSGYGKNSFVYTNDYLENSNNISVTASTTDQKYSSQANIDIKTFQPKILFYKNDALLGTIWEQALSDGHRIQGDEILEATPYFISPSNIRIPTLVFNWFINNEQIATASLKKNFMPLKVQPGTSGTSTIKLQIESTTKLFEEASKEINVVF